MTVDFNQHANDLRRNLGWVLPDKPLPSNLPNLINTDSRSIVPGQWFVPLKGQTHDGHDYISETLARGASGFFYAKSKASSLDPAILPLGIEVQDTLQALQDTARLWRESHTELEVVGITGSSGKTTLKELCALMLAAFAPTLKTEGSLNNEIGVPLTLCKLTSDHRYAVIEMGARHKGDIAFLSKIVQQTVGVLANVGTAHIGEFGSANNILAAKMEIASARKCVYLLDDERIDRSMRASQAERFTFGTHNEADIQIRHVNLTGFGGVSLDLSFHRKVFTLELPYYHDSYPINVSCVLAIAAALGLDPVRAGQSLGAYSGLKGRFKVHRLSELLLIDDSYNANPHSMLAGLRTVKDAFSNMKKLLVLGDMKELGPESRDSHEQVGKFIGQNFQDARLVTVGSEAEYIASGAQAEGLNGANVSKFVNVDELITKLNSELDGAQLLYVKASNSLKLGKLIDTLLSR